MRDEPPLRRDRSIGELDRQRLGEPCVDKTAHSQTHLSTQTALPDLEPFAHAPSGGVTDGALGLEDPPVPVLFHRTITPLRRARPRRQEAPRPLATCRRGCLPKKARRFAPATTDPETALNRPSLLHRQPRTRHDRQPVQTSITSCTHQLRASVSATTSDSLTSSADGHCIPGPLAAAVMKSPSAADQLESMRKSVVGRDRSSAQSFIGVVKPLEMRLIRDRALVHGLNQRTA